MTNCHGRSAITECPHFSSPVSVAGRNFLCCLFKRNCLRLSAQAAKVRERITLPGSQGWRAPQATLDLLAAFLVAHSQWLIEHVDQKWGLEWQRNLLLIPNRNCMIWRSSVHTLLEDFSLCFPQGQDYVSHCLIHQYLSRLRRKI